MSLFKSEEERKFLFRCPEGSLSQDQQFPSLGTEPLSQPASQHDSSPRDHKESNTTEQLTPSLFHTFTGWG